VELSCKTEYALLALLELAAHYDQQAPQQIRHLASRQKISDRYLEQLLATLRRRGLVRSQRGARGGYLLARAPEQIALLDVLDCLEGSETTVSDQPEASTAERDAIHSVWNDIRDGTRALLASYSLQDLRDRSARVQPDLMYYI